MADGAEVVAEAAPDHSAMRSRLVDVQLGKNFSELHPSLKIFDRARREFIFQFRLLRESNYHHLLFTFLIGSAAFVLGAVQSDVFTGGDPLVSGTKGLSQMPGMDFFLLMSSGLMWIWFLMRAWTTFPIMTGHMMNLLIIWFALFVSQILFHKSMPDFPREVQMGEMLTGMVLIAVAIFLSYFFWKAVMETRDLHVKEHHLHEDVRVMEAAMAEHSLLAWTSALIIWVGASFINAWSGANFVADRHAERMVVYFIHIISGPICIAGMTYLLWFPQRMLGGAGTAVRTKRARAAAAELSSTSEKDDSGECPICGHGMDITRGEDGEPILDCAAVDCNAKGSAGTDCSRCQETIPRRITCPNCSTNSPVIDYLPDMEVW